MDFSHKAIEKKWQKKWENDYVNKTTYFHDKKSYILDMFPYPSGAGLHVGHVRGYTATDVISRFRRMQGYGVLHPIGWDAFGLPAEQYALKTGNDPREFTLKNIDTFRQQLKKMGFSYDYKKEINTSNPNFYKTTQWIFCQLFNKGLAELKNVEVNWCQELGTVLANDEIKVVNGKMVSERGEFLVIKKEMRQWVLKITNYAEELIAGLDELDWPKSIKDLQKNWIGKSSGLEIVFNTKLNIPINVFTTWANTIFGVTYLVLSPENPLVSKLTITEQKETVEKYIELTKQKTEIDRKDDSKEKTGVFLGSYAIHPFTKELLPIWISDYVFNDYGTGAVMAVPAHDLRDWDFAKKFNLPIKFVIQSKEQTRAFVGEGLHINSDFLDGLNKKAAIDVISKKMMKMGIAKVKTYYKFRDWLFSRQRFWGEPFPVFYNENGDINLINTDDLPVILPNVDYIKPSKDGQSPLSNIKNWVNFKYDNKEVVRETNTMPQSAGSSWYFLAYILTNLPNDLIDITTAEAKERFAKWLPVDLYIGGQEHAVGHLLYARFWTHFLYDLGIINVKEPFQRLFNQGMILGNDNRKMSKSWGNVINPDEVISSHGADSLRLYEMFMGPLESSLPWSYDGLDSSLKWLNRAYRLIKNGKFSNKNNANLDFIYNDVVKKVTIMVNDLKLNTAISQLMILLNAFYKEDINTIYKPYIEGFVKMLSLFAPHVASEMWEILGNSDHVTVSFWPIYDESKLIINKVKIAVQVNGKLRGVLEVKKDLSKDELILLAKANSNIVKYLENKNIVKEIVIPNKVINIVVE